MKSQLKSHSKFIIGMVVVSALIAISAVSCASRATNKSPLLKPTKNFPLTIADDAGRKLTIKQAPKRIVSLAPSNTEILFALGLGEKVVGVTTYDDYPEAAKSKEKIGDFNRPNIEKILSVKPDLILASSGIQMSLVQELEKLGAHVFVIDSKGLAGILLSINKVGKATGTTANANRLTKSMAAEIEEVRKKAAQLPKDKHPRVFYELYSEPLMTVGRGTFIDSMITTAGGINIASDAKGEYPQYSLETLLQRDPEVYIAVKGPMLDPGNIFQRSGWQNIGAIKNKRVYLVDDNLVSRPGPRIVQGLKSIARAIHPELYGD